MSAEVYEVTIRGNEAALQALTALDEKVRQSAVSTSRHAEDSAKKTLTLGDAFKRVAGDVDAVAGASGAAFGRWAADVFGVVDALGTGGVMGAAAGVTAAVGLGVVAWDAWKEHADKAMKEAEANAERARTAIQRITDLAAQGAAYQGGEGRGSQELSREVEQRKLAVALLELDAESRKALIEVKRSEIEQENKAGFHNIFGLTTKKLKEDIDAINREGVEKDRALAAERRALVEAEGSRDQAYKKEQDKIREAREEQVRTRTLALDLQLSREISTGRVAAANSAAANIIGVTEREEAQVSDIRLRAAEENRLARRELDARAEENRRNLSESEAARVNAADRKLTEQQMANRRRAADAEVDAIKRAAKARRDAEEEERLASKAQHESEVLQRQKDLQAAQENQYGLHQQTLGAIQENGLRLREQREGRTAYETRAMNLLAGYEEYRDHALRVAQRLETQKEAALQEQGISQGAIDAILDQDRAMTQEQIENRRAVTQAAISELEAQKDAERKAIAITHLATAAETGKAAAMMGAQPVINEMLTSERELLMVNRDSLRDYTSQNWSAIIAAKTQAIMAGIAVEATGKMIMEGGEAAAATGAGLGFLAFGNVASASAMFGSAAQHAAAATVFAGIAGVSASGAMVVGSQRGSGGAFQVDKSKEVLTGGDGGGGPTSSGGGKGMQAGNTWNSPSVININNNYGGGGINAQDDRRAAQAVARGVQRANQSYVMRRQMQRAT